MDLKQFVKQTNTFLEDVSEFEEIIQYMYKTLLPLGIRFKYESLDGIETRELTRVVLVAKDTSKHFNKPIVNECAGCILGFYKNNKWVCRLLSRPPNCFYTKYKRVNARDYKVYEAEDGTTITLYWLDGEWRLSTKNGYDVGNLEWRGSKYIDVLTESLANTKPDFDWNRLNKNVSYTIGFCHPDHHPFRDCKRVWFIQSYNLEKNTPGGNPGLPGQKEVFCDDYDELVYNAEASYKRFIKTGEINFGYILRAKPQSRSSRGKYKPDVFIESSLMSNIRRVLYQQKFIKNEETRRKVKKQFARMDYVVLRAYLDRSRRKIIKALFPKYRHKIAELESIIGSAADHLSECAPETDLERDLEDYLYKTLNLYKSTKISREVIMDVITSPSAIDIYAKNLYEWGQELNNKR